MSNEHLPDIIHHGGNEYVFPWDSPGDCVVEYIEDTATPLGVAYRYKLSNAHVGPTIEVLMVTPHDESDGEGGREFVWDHLLWADDLTPVTDESILDTYTDALRDDLENIGKNWD